MDDNSSTGVTAEGGNAFAETPTTQTDTATTPSVDTKPEATTETSTQAKQPEQSNVPFHEHPRFKEIIAQNNDFKKQIEELLPLKDMASRFAPEAPKIPSWFTRIYGEDQSAWQEYNGWNQSQRSEIKAEVLKEYEAKQTKQQEAISSANKHFEDSVSELQSSLTEGEAVDKNKLLKFVVDNDLVDSQGRWNYKSGFKFMRDLEKATLKAQTEPITEAKKQVSDQSVSGSKERKGKNYMTPADFKGKSMFSLK